MAEQDLVSMAQAFTGLPMNDLIGGPLMAAAEANNQMAMTQAKYILDTGFSREPSESDPTKFIYRPIMVDMQLKRPVIIPGTGEDGKPDPSKTKIMEVETVVSVPLITILPINSLAVDEVDIQFEMEVKSSYGKETSQETKEKLAAESSFEAKFGYGPFSATISGSVAYSKESNSASNEKFEKSNSAKYTVHVHASQQPQPAGLRLILEQFAKNIGPYEMGKETGPELSAPSAPTARLSNDATTVEVATAGGGQKALVGRAHVGTGA
ncbi:MAG: DUF2589 domain-containing protein [Verrucomicrobiota bacterium]